MGRSLSTRRTAGTHTGEPPVPAYGQANASAGWARRQALARAAQRAGVTGVAVLLACALGFGLLMLATPSPDNARELAATFDQAHGAPYPGVPVPFRFAAALEATEDHRFNSEPGIDPVAVLRVVYGAMARRGDQGGATLYQQLAKMLYTPGNSSMRAEAEQIALAVKLKYAYSRPEILRLYADVAYFGHGFYGLAEASCGYFGVPSGQMSWPQAALLAGLVQGPTADDPIDHPAAGRAREEHVIGRLVAVGALSQGAAARYLRTPVGGLMAHAGACRG
ncbi:MAG TPA: biosynthetic peptidoglycan transglycosylase [Streptosporangiaceae bacterium]|nr:biosynthetic peptidoglycan transglycosylase [Streptosporangiaceae bacterium]